MRQAIVDALLADDDVAALVGERVYVGRGPYGGISRELTPEAFVDGDLLTSIVVRMEVRTATFNHPIARDGLTGEQVIALWVYNQHSYDPIFATIRACKFLLDHNVSLRPVSDPVAWAETVWSVDGGEQLDPAMEPNPPVVVSRYVATVREIRP